MNVEHIYNTIGITCQNYQMSLLVYGLSYK